MRTFKPTLTNVKKALTLIRTTFAETPLERNAILSKKHGCDVFAKHEDRSIVRSYKYRGAYNKMCSLGSGGSVVTCSAGNHAQGVAYSSAALGMTADIFMPKKTTQQKIDKVLGFGGSSVNVFLEGDSFDESNDIARRHCRQLGLEFVPPFDDEKVIEGQGTVALEILEKIAGVDYLFLPVGGGGLAAGVSSVFKELSPNTKIIGVEPFGAASLTLALGAGRPLKLEKIDTFVDGAAVKMIGSLNYPLCAAGLDKVLLVQEGHVCSKILQMYNESGFIIEPAGVLSLCALDLMAEELKGKKVVCVISGGNSDVFRMPEILERSLIYEGRKQYFKVEFAQKAGALKEFILSVLGPGDDIIYFRYTKLINRETGPVVIGIETKDKAAGLELFDKMTSVGLVFEKLTNVADI
jgi:threonine dehydratase